MEFVNTHWLKMNMIFVSVSCMPHVNKVCVNCYTYYASCFYFLNFISPGKDSKLGYFLSGLRMHEICFAVKIERTVQVFFFIIACLKCCEEERIWSRISKWKKNTTVFEWKMGGQRKETREEYIEKFIRYWIWVSILIYITGRGANVGVLL